MKSGLLKYLLLSFLVFICAFLLLILIGLFVLLGTNTGANWGLKTAVNTQDIEFQWQNLNGTLLSGLEFDDGFIKMEGIEIKFERLYSDWELSQLLAGKLMLRELSAAQLDVLLITSEEQGDKPAMEPAAWPSIELPIAIDLQLARINSLSVSTIPLADINDVTKESRVSLIDLSLIQLSLSARDSALTINEFLVERAEPKKTETVDSNALPFGGIQLAVQVELIPPYALEAEIDWQVHLALQNDDNAELENLNLEGRATLSGSIADLVFEHELTAPITLSTQLSLDTAFDESLMAFDIQQMQMDLRNQWSFNNYSLPSVGQSLSSDGDVSAVGKLSSLNIRAEINAALPELNEIPDQRLELSAQVLGLQKIELSQLKLSSDIGTIEALGSFIWAPEMSWDMQVIADDINTQYEGITDSLDGFSEELMLAAKDVSAEFRTSGRIAENQTKASLEIIKIGGQLRGHDLNATGSLIYENGAILADQLSFSLGNNQLSLNARIQSDDLFSSNSDSFPLEIDWQLQATDLTQVHPEIAGRIDSTGKAKGTLIKPNLEIEFLAEKLVFADAEINQVIVSAGQSLQRQESLQLQESPQQQQSINIEAVNVQLEGQPMIQFSMDLIGDIQKHNYDVRVKRDDITLDFSGTGTLQNQSANLSASSTTGGLKMRDPMQWVTELSQFDIASPSFGDWALEQTATFLVATQNIQLQEFCLLSSPTEICADVLYKDQGIMDIQARINQFNLSRLSQFMPENTAIEGDINALISLAGDLNEQDISNAITGNVELSTTPIDLTVASEDEAEKETKVFQFNDTQLMGVVNAGVLDVELKSNIAKTGFISGDFIFPLGQFDESKRADSSLQGQMQVQLNSLDWLDPFLPKISELNGKTEIDINISGDLDAPIIRGDIEITELAAYMPDAGITLEESHLTLTNTSKNNWDINGSLSSGGGTLDLTGDFGLNEISNWRTSLKIKGDQFFAYSTESISVYISPDLALDMDASKLSATGELVIPKAEIVIKSLPPSSLSVSKDEIIVGETDLEQKPAMDSYIDLSLKLGDEVFFNGFDMIGRLAGQVRARENPEQTLRLDGNIDVIDGTYQSYGQDLKINPGRLIFSGAPDNPNLNVKAYRELDNYVVGVQINGTPEALSSTLYSTPSQSSTDTLAMLITGKPLSGASSGEGVNIANALISLGIAQSDSIAQRLQGSFGLDTLSIGTEDDIEQTAVTIGKYLSPKVFISYVKEILTPNSSVSLDYRPTEKIRINATSGTDQSMDFFYRIERD